MKKIISVLLVLVLVITALPLTGITSFALTSGDWEYAINNGEITFIKYIGTDTEVSIPSMIDGYTVTSIESSIDGSGFADCTQITRINIPDSVTSIGAYAFCGCQLLESIDIPNSVTSIGDAAFAACPSLTSITVPDSVISIGSEAFYNCISLDNITIGKGTKYIGQDAFYNTKYYKNGENWESGVLYCGSFLIKANENIDGNCIIKNGTRVIASYAFATCHSLTSITVPDSVTSICDAALHDCDKLNSIYINDLAAWCNLDNLDFMLFKNDKETNLYLNGVLLTDVVIPDGVTSINDYAFCRCKSVESVTIPNSVTSIGDFAFHWCTSLTNVILPNSVKEIGVNAFRGCKFESVTIPDSVTSIGDYAFSDCTSLTSITIPNSVTSIGKQAFQFCSSLKSITIGNSVTSIGDSVFYSCSNPTIYCPCGSAAYQYAKANNIDCQITTHQYNDGIVTLQPMCTKTGVKTYTCSTCGDTYTETVPALGHSYNSKGVCTRCNDWKYKTGTPKLVSVTNITNGINIKWNVFTGAEGYMVYRKTASSGWKLIASGMSTTTYTDTKAAAGTKYTYTIKAYNGGNNSKFDATGLTTVRLTNPSAKLANTTDGVKVSWAKVTGAKTYYVYRKDASSGYKKIGTVSGTSYLDKSAKAGTKYTYTVRAVNGNVLSAYTGVNTLRLTNPAVKLTNTKSGPKATWGKVTGAKGYYIYRKTSSGSYSKIATTTSLSYVDKTAKKNVKYYYAVKAYNGSYVSAYTAKGITVKK